MNSIQFDIKFTSRMSHSLVVSFGIFLIISSVITFQ